jgi:hypothetical protein
VFQKFSEQAGRISEQDLATLVSAGVVKTKGKVRLFKIYSLNRFIFAFLPFFHFPWLSDIF